MLEYDDKYNILWNINSGNMKCPICLNDMYYNAFNFIWICLNCNGYKYNELID